MSCPNNALTWPEAATIIAPLIFFALIIWLRLRK